MIEQSHTNAAVPDFFDFEAKAVPLLKVGCVKSLKLFDIHLGHIFIARYCSQRYLKSRYATCNCRVQVLVSSASKQIASPVRFHRGCRSHRRSPDRYSFIGKVPSSNPCFIPVWKIISIFSRVAATLRSVTIHWPSGAKLQCPSP